jgi:hypothetical protein
MVKGEQVGICKEVSMVYLRHYPEIRLDRIRKFTKIVTQMIDNSVKVPNEYLINMSGSYH